MIPKKKCSLYTQKTDSKTLFLKRTNYRQHKTFSNALCKNEGAAKDLQPSPAKQNTLPIQKKNEVEMQNQEEIVNHEAYVL